MFEKRKHKNDEKPKRNEYKAPVSRRIWIDGRAIILSLVTTAIIASIFGYYYWTNHTGNGPVLPDSSVIPTPLATKIVPTFVNPWSEYDFLNQEESRSLRKLRNVVNFAVLESNGAVKYSASKSIVFSENAPWVKGNTKPVGFQTLLVSGTSVNLMISDSEYTLNVFQPFAIDNPANADQVYLVDTSGNLWQANKNNVEFVTLSVAQSSLPVGILTNPNLSFSY